MVSCVAVSYSRSDALPFFAASADALYAGAHGAQSTVARDVQARGQEPCTASTSLHGAPYPDIGIAPGILQSLGLHQSQLLDRSLVSASFVTCRLLCICFV